MSGESNASIFLSSDRVQEALMLQTLPDNVCAVGTRNFYTHPINHSEERYVRGAVLKRREEFSTGRWCAHRALTLVNNDTDCIAVGKGGEPIWPDGINGSISHCPSCCIAAVCDSILYPAIGIDVEVDEPLPPGVLNVISSLRERDTFSLQFNGTGIYWDRLLFSVKESLVKAFYSFYGQRIDFSQYRITIDERNFVFHACPVFDGSQTKIMLTGQWWILGGLIMVSSFLDQDQQCGLSCNSPSYNSIQNSNKNPIEKD